MKVKQSMPLEYELIQPGQIVFTYFHFTASRELIPGMVDRQGLCIPYEMAELADGSMSLLHP